MIMAKRPVFVSVEKKPFVKEINVEFTYHSGFAISQKKKNVQSIHEEFLKMMPDKKVIEISTKSDEELGIRLSAFNLYDSKKRSVESLFQGSKVFKDKGPFHDIYSKNSYEAKKDERLKGDLVEFDFEGARYPILPRTFFYDWLYLNVLNQNDQQLKNAILRYNAFTDIEFNPVKSLNCQARSLAIYVSLCQTNLLEEALKNAQTFKEMVYQDNEIEVKERSLFDL